MIITKLRIQEEHPMTGIDNSWPLPTLDLNLTYEDVGNGYNVKEILGLGPPELSAIVVGFDSNGTPIFENGQEKRDLSIKLGLSPQLNQSYSSLRDNIYRLLSRSIFIKLMNDSIVIAQTTGFIKNVEPVHFSTNPEIVINIECVDGVFVAPSYVIIPQSTLTGETNPIINYFEGSAPAGIDLSFQNTTAGSKTGFSISNYSEFWFGGNTSINTLFEITYPIDVDDWVIISTHPKNRFVRFYDDSEAEFLDITGYLNTGAVWPMLYSGVNQIQWDLDWVTEWNLTRYLPRYWGV